MKNHLTPEISKILNSYFFDEKQLDELIQLLKTTSPIEKINELEGTIKPLPSKGITLFPEKQSQTYEMYHAKGVEALRTKKAAALILAGGMATRFGGVVKANVKAIDDFSFLEIKIKDIQETAKQLNTAIPCWVMTSFSTHEALIKEIQKLSSPLCPISAFPQTVSLRLTEEGELFTDKNSSLSPYAPGHGDLPFALSQSGIAEDFIQQGGEVVMMSNVDNLTATFDPVIVGFHLSHQKKITAELVEKEKNDRGGAPANVNGKSQIVEAFRFPLHFDQQTIPYFNTNTFIFNIKELIQEYPFSWFAVRKKVQDKVAVQFERLIGELTAFLSTQYLCVPRYGIQGRFHPIKTPEQLVQQAPEIRTILTNRISKDFFNSSQKK